MMKRTAALLAPLFVAASLLAPSASGSQTEPVQHPEWDTDCLDRAEAQTGWRVPIHFTQDGLPVVSQDFAPGDREALGC